MKQLTLITLLLTHLFGSAPLSIEDVAHKLGLIPGTKAVLQWERIFSDQKRMQMYGIDQLSVPLQRDLKAYLINHAADSEQPIVPGL